MKKSIKLIIDGKEYTAVLNDNETVKDILNMLPLELTLHRFKEHEYYSSLPETPSIKGVPMTSNAHAQGIYYYDGWNAFTVLFGGAHIAPFKVVHVGDVIENVIPQLKNAGETVTARVEIN